MSPTTTPSPSAAALPSSPTSFVGRDREVAAIAAVLTTSRLVTLTGAGGTGKTRLAAEVARTVAATVEGNVAWVELAPVVDPALVAGHVMTTLGIEGGGRSPAVAIRDTLRVATLLLVLDNCEHVIEACATLADFLLRDCAGVTILATSREALGVAGERAWLVPGLSLPTRDDQTDALESSEAVRLFVDRAHAASATFALTEANAESIVRLCRRLDGLPLAIELAAARVRALTPDQIATRLDESLHLLGANRGATVSRHRTLRDAIDWSYELLDESERLVLQRLSVFAGEFSLEAAEAACAGEGIDSSEVLDRIAALVDKSLVVVRDQVDEARYHLLETIREYARERLDESQAAEAVRARHAAFYTTLVREAEPHLITPQRPVWVNRLQRELDDMRAVLAWSRAHDRALHVELVGKHGLGRELGIALQILGTVLLHQRALDEAARSMADALRALKRDPQPFWLARAMELTGIVECARGRPLSAARLFGAAEARRERMGAVLFPLDRERLAPHVASARSAAGEEAFAAAWLEGRTMPFEKAVDAAIEDLGLPPQAPAANVVVAGGPPAPVLRVRALGPLEIERDGVSLPHSAWPYARPRELFLYLMAHREGRTRAQIGLAFWPDAAPAQVKNNFHVMLHHLRRALGRPDIVVFENERYRVNWALGVELDAAKFEAEITTATRALRSDPGSTEHADRLRAILELYRADFLESERAGDWHLGQRERLQRQWVDGLLALGVHLTDTGALEEAVDVHRRILRADALNEEVHRRLMSLLARSGRRGEALRHYESFAATLRDDLGARPEPRTAALFEQLKRG